jgi:hypothetical protein
VYWRETSKTDRGKKTTKFKVSNLVDRQTDCDNNPVVVHPSCLRLPHCDCRGENAHAFVVFAFAKPTIAGAKTPTLSSCLRLPPRDCRGENAHAFVVFAFATLRLPGRKRPRFRRVCCVCPPAIAGAKTPTLSSCLRLPHCDCRGENAHAFVVFAFAKPAIAGAKTPTLLSCLRLNRCDCIAENAIAFTVPVFAPLRLLERKRQRFRRFWVWATVFAVAKLSIVSQFSALNTWCATCAFTGE